MAGDDGGAGPDASHVVAEARARLDRARRSGGTRAVAGPLRRPAPARDRLPDGVPDPGEPGRGPDRDARALARRRFSRRRRRPVRRARRRLLEDADAVLAAGRWRRRHRRGGLGRRRAVAAGRRRLRERDRARASVRAPDLGHRHRPGLLRVRLGDPARRDRLPLCLPVPAARRAAVPAPSRAPAGGVAAALADHARDVGRGADQAARRHLLDRPQLPRLPLRDAADPQPALARVSFPAARGARRGRAVQPHRRAGRAVSDARAVAARALRRRRADGGAAARADRQRQSLVPELADAGADRRLLRRRAVAAHAAALSRRACRTGTGRRRAVARASAPPWRRWASRSRCSASVRS